jgi:hypothetical protein
MNKQNLIFWSFVILILFVGVIQWGEYLIKKKYIIEKFSNGYNSSTNHTVDLPLNTKVSCQNICGPNNRCSLTGEQCSSDIDCFGCNPNTKQLSLPEKTDNYEIHGQNDAGKLTSQTTPTYSILTTDIGTKAKLINKPNIVAAQYFKGVNTWRNTFDDGMELYDKKYTPNASQFTPNYPERSSLSGEFINNGPLAANDFL